jgi:uncharacterized protein YneF (UPF0154 family)
MLKQIIISVIVLICSTVVYGRHSLTAADGLPSNHVYMTMKDRHGYLWIATTNGVVKYNGYEMKVFNTSNGLPSNDVWQLLEDKKGRIWLGCFTTKPGYIYNDEYHSIPIDNNNYMMKLEDFYHEEFGISFFGRHTNTSGTALYIEKNGKIQPTYHFFGHWCLINDKGEFFHSTFNDMDTMLYIGNLYGDTIKNYRHCIYDSINFPMMYANYRMTFGKYLILFHRGAEVLRILNSDNCEILDFSPSKDRKSKITYTYKYRESMYVFTEDKIYHIDTNLQTVGSWKYDQVIPPGINKEDVTYLMYDTLWGTPVCTNGSGLVTNLNAPKLISAYKNELKDYFLIGSSKNSIGYWWNNNTKKLGIVEKGKIKYQSVKQGEYINATKYLNLNSKYSLLLGGSIFLINDVTGEQTKLKLLEQEKTEIQPRFYHSVSDATVVNDTIYTAGTVGLYMATISGNTLKMQGLDYDRYSGILHDESSNSIIAYNSGKILLWQNGLGRSIGVAEAIGAIETLLIDKESGDIIIKSKNKLWIIDRSNLRIRQLLSRYNLADAKIHYDNSTLIAAGRFGIIVLKDFSKEVYYPNTKAQFYSIVTGIQMLENEVLVNTDNGAYKVRVPQMGEIFTNNNRPAIYRLLIDYDKHLYSVKKGFSINVQQDNTSFFLNIIKPDGLGKVKYEYRIKELHTDWQEMRSGELNLPELKADKNYSLVLRVSDDGWISGDIPVHLYVVPYWWQTTTGRNAILVLSILLLGGIIFGTIAITRRIIERNAFKKNRLVELELKSIYSQINPHFIFNTLNTGLYFIKKGRTNEAYNHISGFARLLRSYLDSSRNRFTTIGEEIVNLKNYIELQRMRFDEAFDYDIISDIGGNDHQEIPSLLLQPIVENAINHGLLGLTDRKGYLLIKFERGNEGKGIICTVDDNGIGRNESRKYHDNNVKKNSYGSLLIKELVDIFNKYENMNISLNYTDKTPPESGTTVIISINNHES